MTITLEPVTENNVDEVLALHVARDQEDYVASNEESMSDWKEAEAEGITVISYLIREDGNPAGFIMLSFSDPHEPYIWRFMVDEGRQNRGVGRAALHLLLEGLIRQGAVRITLSAEPDNDVAWHLYRSAGFRRTGEWDDGEAVAALEI